VRSHRPYPGHLQPAGADARGAVAGEPTHRAGLLLLLLHVVLQRCMLAQTRLVQRCVRFSLGATGDPCRTAACAPPPATPRVRANRAHTHTCAQVELAQAEYQLPRVTRMWSHLDRVGGGGQVKGVGEKQIEIGEAAPSDSEVCNDVVYVWLLRGVKAVSSGRGGDACVGVCVGMCAGRFCEGTGRSGARVPFPALCLPRDAPFTTPPALSCSAPPCSCPADKRILRDKTALLKKELESVRLPRTRSTDPVTSCVTGSQAYA
jgi:hypothetical protein